MCNLDILKPNRVPRSSQLSRLRARLPRLTKVVLCHTMATVGIPGIISRDTDDEHVCLMELGAYPK